MKFLSSFAFSSSGLTSITIPASIESMNGDNFNDCASLTAINVDSGNTKYKSSNGVVFTKDGKHLVAIPTGKTGSYTIPSGTEQIDSTCCKGGKLSTVTIPSTVTTIAYRAFSQCLSLSTINYSGTVSAWGSVTQGSEWHSGAPATVVKCSNGNGTLN